MQTVNRGWFAAVALPMALLLAGCAMFGKQEETVTLHIHEQVASELPESHVRTVDIPRAGLRLAIDPYPAISEKDVDKAELVDTTGGAAVRLHFGLHGTVLLDELTTRNRGHYLVVMFNDAPVAAWFVQDRLTNGQLLVEGDFTDEQARKLVDSLNEAAKKRK